MIPYFQKGVWIKVFICDWIKSVSCYNLYLLIYYNKTNFPRHLKCAELSAQQIIKNHETQSLNLQHSQDIAKVRKSTNTI